MTFQRGNLEKQILQIPEKVLWCKRCVISNQRPRITFNDEGVCSGCLNTDYKNHSVNWQSREKELLELYPKRSILNEMPTKKNHYDSILLTVPHKIFKDLGYKKIKELGKEEVLFYDLKNVFPKNKVDFKL